MMMANSPLADIWQKLFDSRAETLQYLRPLDEESAAYRVRPDSWSVKDHVIHLSAVEDSVTHFAHRILLEDCPISPLCYDLAFSQDAWNNRAVAEKANISWREIFANLHEVRQEFFALLERIPENALNRVGAHPIWGNPVTLASVLRVPYRHERAHRDEIVALCARQINRN
jgi:hypothetical protein